MFDPGVVPKEALDYLKGKRLEPAFSYQDVWKEEHNHAFTVAKCMQLDLLNDIQDSLSKAIAEGVPYEKWSKDMTKTMVDAGWWGKQEMVDPLTGEVKMVQLGSSRRIKTIFNVNINSAYQAGVWERGSKSKLHTHIMYRIGPSRQHREEHLGWDALVLPKDDPFWDTHWPPLGWGCKCKTRFLMQSQVDRYEREGLPDMTSMVDGYPTRKTSVRTTAPKDVMVSYVNKRTGKSYTIPEGVDPGFEFNQGKREVAQKQTAQLYQEKFQQATDAINGSTAPANTAMPVSRNIVSEARKNTPVVDRVLKAIDSIHGDGSLPGVPVKTSRAKSFYGQYSFSGSRSNQIALTDIPGSHKELTLAHEIGHYLDHQGLPGPGLTSRAGGFKPLENVLDAIGKSDSIAMLKKAKVRNLHYYLKKEEEFARAYAQYVATKSADPVLLEQLQQLQTDASDYRYIQWTNEDFVPIMKSMDDMFKELGWIREG
ncbi:hypothetical protein SDC9_102334 [bioreactor metagenome]|uniref:Phage head morphogenesis domain-containing protein n=1 Tax=bioreactor metagenome TaxID=1076179 RepID=A0A645AR50_9ZZZZ